MTSTWPPPTERALTNRRDVLTALEEWEGTGSTIEDIVTDTGLSLWTIRLVLDELVNADPPLLGVQDVAKDRGAGRRGKVYRLLQPPDVLTQIKSSEL